MATSLVLPLRGQAPEIPEQQSFPKEQQNDYNMIVGALEIRYRYKYLRQVYQSQLKSRQQSRKYEADIEHFIHLAYPQAPKEFLEQIGIQTFVDGLLDNEMQQALRLGRHITISDVLVATLEFEAAKKAPRRYKPRVRQIKFDECQSFNETMEKIIRELNEMRQSNSPQKETWLCYKLHSRANSPDRQLQHPVRQLQRSRSLNERKWREEISTPMTSQQRNNRSPTPDRRSLFLLECTGVITHMVM
ncbi:hypothetical protein NQ318_012328 [Aromia moschata]|uniref:Uncharacterized protein n=1 Tax=Aromia moschata TaxID=1265417 RepID=A0AAV8YLQ4_9CUCU|nr:hypothetical protein NQ318_012328 [Aromia moschata]